MKEKRVVNMGLAEEGHGPEELVGVLNFQSLGVLNFLLVSIFNVQK